MSTNQNACNSTQILCNNFHTQLIKTNLKFEVVFQYKNTDTLLYYNILQFDQSFIIKNILFVCDIMYFV